MPQNDSVTRWKMTKRSYKGGPTNWNEDEEEIKNCDDKNKYQKYFFPFIVTATRFHLFLLFSKTNDPPHLYAPTHTTSWSSIFLHSYEEEKPWNKTSLTAMLLTRLQDYCILPQRSAASRPATSPTVRVFCIMSSGIGEGSSGLVRLV